MAFIVVREWDAASVIASNRRVSVGRLGGVPSTGTARYFARFLKLRGLVLPPRVVRVLG